ncbi:MerR family transcriptional regulator [Salinisphaera sp. USBA-960]|uniref:MerR family transcriptional regulator n=1 Tax=Salinisphaera orenii TaxID=856731 RepID=UPI000DBDFF5E|nr:MerR family transcriptional regulator [Salifodinibacter halophilus]NNC26023.1 MerR family transcriptional regulator [Salifodinibacter halophilus]
MAPESIESLPAVPDKRYFTIGEVSELCALKPHVLRYWEQEFSQLKPVKRRGNRRYYQQRDVMIAREIRSLLYEHGFTIPGARMQLKGKGKTLASLPSSNAGDSLAAVREELENLRDSL